MVVCTGRLHRGYGLQVCVSDMSSTGCARSAAGPDRAASRLGGDGRGALLAEGDGELGF